jgi:hypothetical protein
MEWRIRNKLRMLAANTRQKIRNVRTLKLRWVKGMVKRLRMIS